ncbi:MAG: hypothetical protein PWP23_2483 [Candidatus Sumerlaeota bacterium]|nr:hypothetical protein [Candidatus Sumerlaeota bacterium]
MGVAVSDWRLARAVSREGMLGVVSGTALEQVVARRLQMGDPGGHMRRALAQFPHQPTVERILARYFVPGGIADDARMTTPPMWRVDAPTDLLALTVASSFAEVWLAREGHDAPVGINALEKIQLPNLATLYGAMLAGVDVVLMGAGIPAQIPGILDTFVHHGVARMRIAVDGDPADRVTESVLDPRALFGDAVGEPLRRPFFLPIISSNTLAQALLKRATGKIDGFIVEHHTAGGHNAPPRGHSPLNDRGEPVYGNRDSMDFAKLHALGIPFWLGGGTASPERLAAARAVGAQGIQVGTAFAFCNESGVMPELRAAVLESVRAGTADVFTDPLASPTGFPFKVVRHPDTVSEPECYLRRERICDGGHLRHIFRKEDGTLGYRCPAEPEKDYVAKGGSAEETVGRKCICNALIATVGLGQRRSGGQRELPIVTAGDDLLQLIRAFPATKDGYSVRDVRDYLMSEVPSPAPTSS